MGIELVIFSTAITAIVLTSFAFLFILERERARHHNALARQEVSTQHWISKCDIFRNELRYSQIWKLALEKSKHSNNRLLKEFLATVSESDIRDAFIMESCEIPAARNVGELNNFEITVERIEISDENIKKQTT